MGPILSYDNIVDIYIKAEKKKKVFFNKFKIKLPNLLKIYELYHDAINVESLISHTQNLNDNNQILSPQTIKHINSNYSKNAIEELKKY